MGGGYQSPEKTNVLSLRPPGSHREWMIWTQTPASGIHILPKKPTAQSPSRHAPSVLEAMILSGNLISPRENGLKLRAREGRAEVLPPPLTCRLGNKLRQGLILDLSLKCVPRCSHEIHPKQVFPWLLKYQIHSLLIGSCFW